MRVMQIIFVNEPIQEYEKAGIDVYSLSMQNEAQNNQKMEAATWSDRMR